MENNLISENIERIIQGQRNQRNEFFQNKQFLIYKKFAIVLLVSVFSLIIINLFVNQITVNSYAEETDDINNLLSKETSITENLHNKFNFTMEFQNQLAGSKEVVEIENIESIEQVKEIASERSIYNKNIDMPKEHQEYLYQMCQERGLDYKWVLAVVKHESQFDSQAIGVGDYGYFQVNEFNHSYLADKLKTENNPLDPYININWGTYMLADLFDYWEEEGLTGKQLEDNVLSCYNKGINGFREHGKAVNYISKVEEEKLFIAKAFELANN